MSRYNWETAGGDWVPLETLVDHVELPERERSERLFPSYNWRRKNLRKDYYKQTDRSGKEYYVSKCKTL